MAPIPVLIVAYKNPEAMRRCVDSVLRQQAYDDADGFDDLREYTRLPARILARDNSAENLGYTAGMNRLLAAARCGVWNYDGPNNRHDYAVLLNQDAILFPDAMASAVAFMDAHPRCAIAGFKQLDPDNPDIITHGGTGTPYPYGVHLGGRVSAGDCAESRKMLWVNGAAMIVRLSALNDIGLMDERFFLIGNDSDWCMTAWMKGWEVWYCAEAVCLHGSGGCSRDPTPEQSQTHLKDMAAWGEKWAELLAGVLLAGVNPFVIEQQGTP